MDTIASAEFRKTYASLHSEVYVTVNGHVIGKWTPTWDVVHLEENGPVIRHDRDVRYSSRPFTPVPKR